MHQNNISFLDWLFVMSRRLEDVILLPHNRWAGVSGSISVTSVDTYVRGWSFSVASISTTMVWRTGRVTNALPSTFLSDCFMSPTSLSQKPLCQGGFINIQYCIYTSGLFVVSISNTASVASSVWRERTLVGDHIGHWVPGMPGDSHEGPYSQSRDVRSCCVDNPFVNQSAGLSAVGI